MTREEKAAALELARQLCLEIAESERSQLAGIRQLAGMNSPGFNQTLGAMEGAQRCAEAIEEAKGECGG